MQHKMKQSEIVVDFEISIFRSTWPFCTFQVRVWHYVIQTAAVFLRIMR